MMINCYEFLLAHTPTAYRGEENTQKLLKVWASIFQEIVDSLETFSSDYYLSNCGEEELELMASNENVVRNYNWTLETLRAVTKIARYNTTVIPTHNNILEITKNVTGQSSVLEPLWNAPNYSDGDTDAGYRQSFKVSSSYPTIILDKLGDLFPAGIKLERIYEFSVAQRDLKVSTIMLDIQQLNVGYKKEEI